MNAKTTTADPTPLTPGQRLRQARLAKGLSPEKLVAALVPIPPLAYTTSYGLELYEADARVLEADLARRFAQTLGVSAAWLLCVDEPARVEPGPAHVIPKPASEIPVGVNDPVAIVATIAAIYQAADMVIAGSTKGRLHGIINPMTNELALKKADELIRDAQVFREAFDPPYDSKGAEPDLPAGSVDTPLSASVPIQPGDRNGN